VTSPPQSGLWVFVPVLVLLMYSTGTVLVLLGSTVEVPSTVLIGSGTSTSTSTSRSYWEVLRACGCCRQLHPVLVLVPVAVLVPPNQY
jgi:hypothetical protein